MFGSTMPAGWSITVVAATMGPALGNYSYLEQIEFLPTDSISQEEGRQPSLRYTRRNTDQTFRLEMWAYAWVEEFHPGSTEYPCKPPTTSLLGTGVLIHTADRTQSQPPTRAYTYEANTPENKNCCGCGVWR
jgi:hypothetical protein